MNRWLLEGKLTTLSPLHIGTGSTDVSREALRRKTAEGEKGDPIEVSAVATDADGRAYIPGSTLKGNLRSWLAAREGDTPRMRCVFGFGPDRERRDPLGEGGKAEFRDALAIEPENTAHPPAYWDPRRLTGVAASVALDRRTRTAKDEKLAHLEFVPPGVTFKVTIAGQGEGESEEEIALLLRALEGFQGTEPVTLGSRTADGWGRVQWKLTAVRRLDAKGIQCWHESGAKEAGDEILAGAQISEEEVRRLVASWPIRLDGAPPVETRARRTALCVHLALRFESRFLVNDPSQKGKGASLPGHAPLRDARGRPLLPARSFRGAFRSQAERILRTIGADAAACDSVGKGCKGLASGKDLKKLAPAGRSNPSLCPACRIFGAPGWRAPVEVSDFVADGAVSECRQEFLAIDRFTGGGVPGLKFNALAADRPVFTGRLSVDLAALEKAGVGPWGLGLLALTLRDLLEGDICFGFGASKGYGACRATIISIELPPYERLPQRYRGQLQEGDLRQISLEALPGAASPLWQTLKSWVVDLGDTLSTNTAPLAEGASK